MPNLIQSEIPLIRTTGNVVGNLGFLPSLREMSEVEFRVDTRVLVQPYLTVVVSGLFLIVSLLDQRMKQGFIPRALCLGVGGGALLSFLNTRLGFEVVGVEADEVACGRMKGDTHDLQVNIDCLNAKFDVVMVDLDSSDVRTGISAPPPESVRKPFFQASKSVLHDHGFFVINVVPPDERFYVTLIQELQDVFHNVHEINIENEDKFVLVATVSPIASNDHDNAFIQKAEKSKT
ncbi:methyltransferase-like protein 13 [Cynara cardunculus var. scolymus]|uniref:methyltransferase-like protein 13 n=1 Tax=Cynara cardunculus var. scolymus TaxID=59895 RepID=UPI000D62E568|nr:methyltransferase-like protein 13 [Cynara cardunculus var. scolymus]